MRRFHTVSTYSALPLLISPTCLLSYILSYISSYICNSLALESQGIVTALLGVATSGAIFARASGAIANVAWFALIHVQLADFSLPKLGAVAFLLIGASVAAGIVHAF